jgi:hypothetical protein
MPNLPVYEVNDFILEGTNISAPANPTVGEMMGYTGTGFKPIYPAQSVPEVDARTEPYIVYSTRRTTDIERWWETVEETTYVFYHKSIDTLDNISTELFDVFKRMDETAEDINAYLGVLGRDDYTFQYFRVLNDFSPEPAEQEGGLHGKIFTIRYAYVVNSGRNIE